MKALEIFNEELIDFFGTSQITNQILSRNNEFYFTISTSFENSSILEELNKIVDYFEDIKCSITIDSKDEELNREQLMNTYEYYTILDGYSKAIELFLDKTSPNFAKITINSFFHSLNLPTDLMKKFTKLDTLIINGYGEDSNFATVALPPNLSEIKIGGLYGGGIIDTSQVKNLSDLVLFLDYKSLVTSPYINGIEHLDLSYEESNSPLNLNYLQIRFPNLKSLKLPPGYKILGPLYLDEIIFLVKVAGQIQIENINDDIIKFFLGDYIPLEISGIKKIGNIYFDPKRIKLKPIEMSYQEYTHIEDKSKFKSALLRITINNMSELSTEEASELKRIAPNCLINIKESSSLSIHSLDEYILMSKNLDHLLSNIDSSSSELEKYTQIYKSLSSIYYNYDALLNYSPEYEEKYPFNNFFAASLSNNPGNPYGALLYRSALCSGFASTLHNACTRLGIKSKIVEGCLFDFVDFNKLQKYDEENHQYIILDSFDTFNYLIKDLKAKHAWNLVRIDGTWYNSDLTWDADNIRNNFLPKYFLFSDNENIQRKCISKSSLKCNSSFSSGELSKIFPDLQPEPPSRNTVISSKQFDILKKYQSKLYYYWKIISKYKPNRIYRETTKKYPMSLNSSSTEEKTSISPAQKNVREAVRYPSGFAINPSAQYERSSNAKVDPENTDDLDITA